MRRASGWASRPAVSGVAGLHRGCTSENHRAYDQLLGRSREEVLVCNKAPYASVPNSANPAVLEALGRGVAMRALYEHDGGVEPVPGWRAGLETYHAAGVVGRVLDKIPVKMAIFDRRASLLTLIDPAAPAIGFPAVLLIEQPDLAKVLVGSFEHLWAESQPYPVPNLEGARS